MPSLRSVLAAPAAIALIAGAAACSSDDGIPTDPPRPMSARVIVDGDSKTYDLSVCTREDEQSLLATGSDQVSELLGITIEDGVGDVSVVSQSSLILLGQATDYTIDESLEFEITGTYDADGEQAELRVWGSCAEVEEEF